MLKQCFLAVTILLLASCMVSAAAEKPMLYLEDNVLAAGNYNVSMSSSDISLIIRIEAGEDIVVDEGMALGYTIPQREIDGWTEVDFDDSGWEGGKSGVGYSDNDDNTNIRGAAGAIYSRYYFDVPDAKDIREITVLVDYDDAFVLWLNGVEIARSSNMAAISPGEVPRWDGPVNAGMSDHEASGASAGEPNEARWNRGGIQMEVVEVDYGGQKPAGSAGKPPESKEKVTIAPLYLKDNVLAGANFNDGPSSSDMTLIMRLMGDDEIYVDEGSPVMYIHDPDNENVDESWIQVEFDDSRWEEGISGVGFSDGDDNTTVPAGLISIWTRYYFDAPNADKISELILLADYDDTYIAYLNGVPIAFGGGAPAGDPPAWNATQAGTSTNHGATEMAAGEPNEARWNQGGVQRTTVEFRYAGSSSFGVDSKNKLTTTWGNVKN